MGWVNDGDNSYYVPDAPVAAHPAGKYAWIGANSNSPNGQWKEISQISPTEAQFLTQPPSNAPKAPGEVANLINNSVNESSLGLNGPLFKTSDGYYTSQGKASNVTDAMIPGLQSGANTRQQQAIEHNQKDHTTELAALAGFAGLGALGAAGAGGGLLGDTAASNLITPETASQLAANAGGASLAPGTTTLNGALEAAVGNAGQMSLMPGSLASGAAGASGGTGLLSNIALQAAKNGVSLIPPDSPAVPTPPPATPDPTPPVSPPQQPPAPVTDATINPIDPMAKLKEWITQNPLQALSLGLTATGVLGGLSNKLKPEDTYQAPSIDQSIVSKYGHVPAGGLLQAGGDPTYQGFESLQAPSGLLQMRLNKMRGIL